MATLRITISGLFLVVGRPSPTDKDRLDGVTALAVDARNPARTPREPQITKHLDGSDATFHVGFVRIPLRHLEGAPLDGVDELHEVVLRLDREEILIPGVTHTLGGLTCRESGLQNLVPGPDISAFGDLRVDPRCLTDENPPDSVLSRLTLRNGTFVVADARGRIPCTIPKTLEGDPSGRTKITIIERFVWEGEVPDRPIHLVLAPFDGAPARTFPLRVVDGTCQIQLVNFCASNPLGWEEVKPVSQTGDSTDAASTDEPAPSEDHDVKWLFLLLEDHEGIKRRLGGNPLPIPRAVHVHGPGPDGGWGSDWWCVPLKGMAAADLGFAPPPRGTAAYTRDLAPPIADAPSATPPHRGDSATTDPAPAR